MTVTPLERMLDWIFLFSACDYGCNAGCVNNLLLWFLGIPPEYWFLWYRSNRIKEYEWQKTLFLVTIIIWCIYKSRRKWKHISKSEKRFTPLFPSGTYSCFLSCLSGIWSLYWAEHRDANWFIFFTSGIILFMTGKLFFVDLLSCKI